MATVNHNERGSTSVLRPFQGDGAKHDSSSDASALEDFKRAVLNSPLTFKPRRGNVDGNIQYAYGEMYKGSRKSFEEFYRQMHESEGFEVDYFPDVVAIDMNIPSLCVDFGQGLTVKELFNRGLSARPLLNR